MSGVFLLVVLLLSLPAQALARESPKDFVLPSTVDFLRSPNVRAYSDLSPSALSVADALGIGDDLKELDRLSREARGDRLSMLAIKQNLTESILSQGFEVRAVISKIDIEIADSDDLQALLEERRDQAVRLNSIANFISGGVTGILGSAFNLGDINSKVDDSIDLSDGVVQSSLALLALKQQQGEKRLVKGMPNMLSRLFEAKQAVEYPERIWNFINSVPLTGGQTSTRKEVLMAHWRRLGLIDRVRRDQPTEQLRLNSIVGTAPKCRVSIDLLDARSAMLHDLRAVISEMDNYLLELIQYLRSVKV
ncbi:MAG: hypothetical protein HY986_25090 [Candidatus Melainabacteria bacterium]|nr:hypothetical protein [Candidatus Melainabacteria bacterium]